jgi:hypothetical protein
MATVYQLLLPEEAQFLGSSFAQFNKVNGTNVPVASLAYDAAATEYGFWKWAPFQYGSGNITCDLFWYADTATSGVVRWEVALAAITPDVDTQDVETKALATALTVDDTHLGTVGQRLHRASVAISNLDSVAAGDECWLRVGRIGGNAADTMAGDALLSSVRLSYSDA